MEQQYAMRTVTTCVVAVIFNIVAEAPFQDVSCVPKEETACVLMQPDRATDTVPVVPRLRAKLHQDFSKHFELPQRLPHRAFS